MISEEVRGDSGWEEICFATPTPPTKDTCSIDILMMRKLGGTIPATGRVYTKSNVGLL